MTANKWGEIIGKSLRYGLGAGCFGIWQGSIAAGFAFFFLLVTLESDWKT